MPSSSSQGSPAVTTPLTPNQAVCESCREQRVKCDRGIPCGRCVATRRECTRTGLKIRVTKKNFPKKQKWVKTPRRLDFIDETQVVSKEAVDQGAAGGNAEADPESPSASEDGNFPSTSSLTRPDLSRTTTASSGIFDPCRSPTDRFIQRDLTSPPFHQHSTSPSLDRRGIQDPSLRQLMRDVYLARSVFPLSDPEEARLLGHFVQNLARWLDLCDPVRSFETIVPHRASTCTVLMNAIFALSSRHMSYIQKAKSGLRPNPDPDEPLSTLKYGCACSEKLRPMLEYDETMSDENMFAAAIILRVWEEMGVINIGKDYEGYMLSINHFVEKGGQLQDSCLIPGSLGAASFWVGLRQEIYVAVVMNREVRLRLVRSLVDPLRSFEAADDHTWANRAVLHCAEVLNFYHGSRSPARWRELQQWNRLWEDSIPESYAPIFQEDENKHAFPAIWYLQSCHVIGVQHHLLAQLFILNSDNTELYGSSIFLRERIQTVVRKICGIGLGNQSTPPSVFTACMAISAFGCYFQDRRDQEEMMRLLIKTEEDHARPTESVQIEMRRVWGWVSDGSHGETVPPTSHPGWQGNSQSTHIMGVTHEMSL
ncbi:hypothetical protein QBC39DRAFT_139994 [Podospora conica]|nr:hypothetical protein QBC39DRAFT_139994 [Schizothecium conicum]